MLWALVDFIYSRQALSYAEASHLFLIGWEMRSGERVQSLGRRKMKAYRGHSLCSPYFFIFFVYLPFPSPLKEHENITLLWCKA